MYMYVNNIIHITYYTIYPCSALRSYTHFVEFTALICKQRANHLKQSLYLQQQHTQWLDCIACKISRSNLFMPSFDNTIATKIEYKIGEEIIWETKLPDSIHTQNKQSMLALLEKKIMHTECINTKHNWVVITNWIILTIIFCFFTISIEWHNIRIFTSSFEIVNNWGTIQKWLLFLFQLFLIYPPVFARLTCWTARYRETEAVTVRALHLYTTKDEQGRITRLLEQDK